MGHVGAAGTVALFRGVQANRRQRRCQNVARGAWWTLLWRGGVARSGSRTEGSTAATAWWREHPMSGDVFIGWVQHPQLANGDRCDIEVECISSTSGVWRSRRLHFEGEFVARSALRMRIVFEDDMTVLEGLVHSPEVISGTMTQLGTGGGIFELRALPAAYRLWWDLKRHGQNATRGNSAEDGAAAKPPLSPAVFIAPKLGPSESGDGGVGPQNPSGMQVLQLPSLLDVLSGARLFPQEKPQKGGEQREPSEERLAHVRRFSMTPEGIKAYLDRYVVKQDVAKETLAVAICDHYNRVREELEFESRAVEARVLKDLAGSYSCSMPGRGSEVTKVRICEDASVLAEGEEDISWHIDASGPGEPRLLSRQDTDFSATLSKSSRDELVWQVDQAEEPLQPWTRIADRSVDQTNEGGSEGGSAGDPNLQKRAGHKPSSDSANYTKPNILLLGPTGSGKTYLLKTLARLVGVPFVKADATKFTETGYVGRDADDVLQDLVTAAGGDVNVAQFGIVYIDEIDKVCAEETGGGHGSFRRGVQNTFLKLMEDMEVTLSTGPPQAKTPGPRFSTRHVLFVFSGAFSRLNDRLRNEKVREASGFGFTAEAQGGVSNADLNSYLHEAGTDELVKAGLEPEFVGRIPVRVALSALSEEDLLAILTEVEGGASAQLVHDFRRYGIRLSFTEGALRAVARRAVQEKTGARSLVTVLETTLRRFKFRLPTLVPRGCEELVVTEDTVGRPEDELERLVALYAPPSEEHASAQEEDDARV